MKCLFCGEKLVDYVSARYCCIFIWGIGAISFRCNKRNIKISLQDLTARELKNSLPNIILLDKGFEI